ncbi:MAG: hypothetical protein AB8C84_05385 [Oligoflexales bacterium]
MPWLAFPRNSAVLYLNIVNRPYRFNECRTFGVRFRSIEFQTGIDQSNVSALPVALKFQAIVNSIALGIVLKLLGVNAKISIGISVFMMTFDLRMFHPLGF